MGCVCCSFSSFTSVLLQALERISLCTVCAMMTCCLMCTIMMVLGLGVGIGFHYCTVQNAVAGMEAAAKLASGAGAEARRSGAGPSMIRSIDQAVQRGFAHRLTRRELDKDMPSNNNTINDILIGNQTSSGKKYATFGGKNATIEIKDDTFGKIIGSLLYAPRDFTHRLSKRAVEQDMPSNSTANGMLIGNHTRFEKKDIIYGNCKELFNGSVSFGS